jgi:hypothetical protein
MPVIRSTFTPKVLKREQRKELLDQLAKELKGETTANGLVIFEIPLQPTDKMDVLVVWEAWKDVPADIRSEIILDAYREKKSKISQALGVTHQEAIEQHVLPYSVLPMTRRGEVDPATLKTAMLEQGGLPLDGNKVDLRFPTLAMAEEAHQRLCDKLPKGYWSIVQSVNPIY